MSESQVSVIVSYVSMAILLAGIFAIPFAMQKFGMGGIIDKLSPNAWWGLNLSDGTWVNILIPREKEPRAYVATWMRLNPGKRVVRAVNSEDGSVVLFS